MGQLCVIALRDKTKHSNNRDRTERKLKEKHMLYNCMFKDKGFKSILEELDYWIWLP
jgi:hypothetical protein